MKTTDYAGIDYGLGKSNVDAETGIRYGVIGQNSETLNQDAVQDIYSQGTDLGFEEYQNQVKANLRAALSDYFIDHNYRNEDTGTKEPSKLDVAVADAFDAVSDGIGDAYSMADPSGPYLYERDGYVIKTSETDLWVLKSPYFTHAQFCSPCAPGAGNLDTACPDGPKTYCLGPEWFDDDKAPYPVFNVADLKAA